MPEGYIKAEKEQITIEVTTQNQVLIGKFTKDKGIRFTSYFNRDETKHGFIVLSDVQVLDIKTRELTGNKKFLAVNVDYIVTATEMDPNE